MCFWIKKPGSILKNVHHSVIVTVPEKNICFTKVTHYKQKSMIILNKITETRKKQTEVALNQLRYIKHFLP